MGLFVSAFIDQIFPLKACALCVYVRYELAKYQICQNSKYIILHRLYEFSLSMLLLLSIAMDICTEISIVLNWKYYEPG